MKRAVVLGGGGPIGVAWESGIAQGLYQGGVDLRIADLIVGTSAGSLVGARLAHGELPLSPRDPAGRAAPPLRGGGPDMAALGRIFGLWTNPEPMTAPRAAQIGALAQDAQTVDEATWVAAISASAPFPGWPQKALRVVAYDTGSGERVVFPHTDAPLDRALASSCAVPGIFPTVSIGDRRYMDGGIASATHADVAGEIAPDAVLVIAVITSKTSGGGLGAVLERAMNQEVEQLRRAGADVRLIVPDDDDVTAFGPNLMDAGRSPVAYESGLKHGLEAAAALRARWSSQAA
jgi:NTE family protein